MKQFKDLERGDKLYRVRIDDDNIFKVYFSSFDIISVIGKNAPEDNPITILYRDNSQDQGQMVDRDTSECKIEYRPALREIYYFSDRLAVEKFIKKRCESLRDKISIFENLYKDVWKEEDPETSLTDFKKGEVIYIDPFRHPGICDGKGSVYFHDGEPFKLEIFNKSKKIRRATDEEVKEFIRKLSLTVASTADSTMRSKLIVALRNCGYGFNLVLREFYKDEKIH